MLKITSESIDSGNQLLRVEGRLAGPWVGTLKSECDRALDRGDRLTLELSGVSFADPQGLRLLQNLLYRSVALMGRTPFVAAQLGGHS
jgi:hypothetical protein